MVIALTVRGLPKKQRRVAMLTGAWLAVIIRIAITFLAARLLELPYLQFAGGAFVLWIAVKVFRDAKAREHSAVASHEMWRAIGSIMLADLTMSTDNILAVAGASHGNIWLIVFGLALSIPLVVSSSTLLASIMDKYPVTIYIGVAILARVGGEMMMNDPFIQNFWHPSAPARYGVDLALIAVVIAAGRWFSRDTPSRDTPSRDT